MEVQEQTARRAAAELGSDPWVLPEEPLLGGCFVAFAPGPRGPGRGGERAWAAAVTMRAGFGTQRGDGTRWRRSDDSLRESGPGRVPRRAKDVDDQVVLTARVDAPYVAGFLALRQGPVLTAVLSALESVPDVLLVDGTGLDHPRGAGLALHLGAVAGVATVGVTHRPLVARGAPPVPVRGAVSAVALEGRTAGYWVCTRTGARPVLAHAGWRTGPETAAAVVLLSSTEAARTPVPLQEARRAAREARALGLAGDASPAPGTRPG